MRPAVTAASLAGCALIASGCGGGRHDQASVGAPPARAIPVAVQVRDALRGALSSPAFTGLFPSHDPQLPWRSVRGCQGPAGGEAGVYRCATIPRGPRGVRSVTVTVKRNGQWSTRPLRITTTSRGRRLAAVTAVWGIGIKLAL